MVGLELGCDNLEFLFIMVERRGFGVWFADGGGGVEIRVTNYLVRFTPSLSANFKVEKMSDVSVCFKTALT